MNNGMKKNSKKKMNEDDDASDLLEVPLKLQKKKSKEEMLNNT